MLKLRRIRQIEPDERAAASVADVRSQRVVPAVDGRRPAPRGRPGHDAEPAGNDDESAGCRPSADLGAVDQAICNGLAVIVLMVVIAIVLGDARVGLGGALFVATIASVRFSTGT